MFPGQARRNRLCAMYYQAHKHLVRSVYPVDGETVARTGLWADCHVWLTAICFPGSPKLLYL